MAALPDTVAHDGLVLRRWTPDDAQILNDAVLASIEHLRPYMPWIRFEPMTVAARRVMLTEWEQQWRDGGDCVMGIFDAGEVVGSTGLHRRIGPSGLEIGYWVHPDHLGRGIALRASEALTSLAFTVPGIEVVEIHHDLTNTHSRRVPEELGYHLVGKVTLDRELAPGETGLDLVWRIDAEQWAARQGR